jgi:hypothetical protein
LFQWQFAQSFMCVEFARALLAERARLRELLDDRNRHVPQPAFAGCHGIDQQHRNGHRADAARHGRDVRRLRRHAFEIDVADKPAVLEAVDADVATAPVRTICGRNSLDHELTN